MFRGEETSGRAPGKKSLWLPPEKPNRESSRTRSVSLFSPPPRPRRPRRAPSGVKPRRGRSVYSRVSRHPPPPAPARSELRGAALRRARASYSPGRVRPASPSAAAPPDGGRGPHARSPAALLRLEASPKGCRPLSLRATGWAAWDGAWPRAEPSTARLGARRRLRGVESCAGGVGRRRCQSRGEEPPPGGAGGRRPAWGSRELLAKQPERWTEPRGTARSFSCAPCQLLPRAGFEPVTRRVGTLEVWSASRAGRWFVCGGCILPAPLPLFGCALVPQPSLCTFPCGRTSPCLGDVGSVLRGGALTQPWLGCLGHPAPEDPDLARWSGALRGDALVEILEARGALYS